MRHLPLLIAVFLILAAGFLASTINSSLTSHSIYGQKSYYGAVEPGSEGEVLYKIYPGWGIYNTQTVSLEKLDFNKDGVINKDDVRDHNNILRRCIDALWSPFCVPGLDMDGNGRYEYRDNTILYDVVTHPTSSGQSSSDIEYQKTDDCELGRLKCIGEPRYNICGNHDGDAALEWSDPIRVEKGKICRNNKIVTSNFNPNY